MILDDWARKYVPKDTKSNPCSEILLPNSSGTCTLPPPEPEPMTDQHPIIPPPELVQQWHTESYRSSDPLSKHVATRAAQWGADQELEACATLMPTESMEKYLRTARRPKPQTLNSIALQMLGTIERDAHYLPEITDTIRKALEQLND